MEPHGLTGCGICRLRQQRLEDALPDLSTSLCQRKPEGRRYSARCGSAIAPPNWAAGKCMSDLGVTGGAEGSGNLAPSIASAKTTLTP